MLRSLLLGALLLAGPARADDPWLRSAAAAHSFIDDDAVLWSGSWEDLSIVSTMVYAGGGIAALSAPDGSLFTVHEGSHVGSRYEEVVAIRTGRVELVVETDDARTPWCVLALELAQNPPELDAKGRPLPQAPGKNLRTDHSTVACAPTRELAIKRAVPLATGS